MRTKKEIMTELRRMKRLHREETDKDHIYSAEAMHNRGTALCWVLGLNWSDIVPEEAEG